MLNTPPTYGSPVLQDHVLKATLLAWYPKHDKSVKLLEDLIEEYKRFWRLVLSYPHRRVVAPGPVMDVQRAHQSNQRRYFDDCMNYFNEFKRRRDFAWKGRTDYVGIHDTITVYQDLFQTNPPGIWNDMSEIYGLKKGIFRLI